MMMSEMIEVLEEMESDALINLACDVIILGCTMNQPNIKRHAQDIADEIKRILDSRRSSI